MVIRMENRSAADVMEDKYKDRGWGQYDTSIKPSDNEPIKPLPITLEKYQMLMSLLGELAYTDQNEQVAAVYFELQRRASLGNGFDGLEVPHEEDIWNIGLDSSSEEEKKGR